MAEAKIKAKDLKAPQDLKHENIVFRIVEIVPTRSYTGRKILQIAYQIVNGKWTSPVAHLWLHEFDDVKPQIRRIVDNYLTMKKAVR